MTEEEKEQISEDEGINLLDYLIVLAKRKKLIITITLPVAVISGIISLLSSVSFYVAQTTILPPQSGQPSFARQFIDRLGLGLGSLQGSSTMWNQRLIVELIKSRTVTNMIIERFNLKEHYDAEDNDEKTSRLFWEHVTIEPSYDEKFRLGRNQNSPLIRISVADGNPERAANIANAIVEELKIAVNNISISEASQRRLFFEEQLKRISEDLIKSEEDIKTFHEETGILKVETQTGIVIEKIAGLQAQISAKEVELQVRKSYSTANNPDVQIIEETIKGLKKELAKLESNERNSRDLLIPTGTVPALGLEYKRIFRQLKFNETLYEIMVKQYESAKIDEAKNTTFVNVIDKAVPPEKPASMRRWGGRKALAVTFFTFIFSCFLAFAMEYHERSAYNKEHNEKIQALMRYLSFKRNK
jgi:capsule polysaccharide export protein KpsE/RkpR